ncbi:hypothetical protein Hanom_Chr08g00723441 [Helianthus anomalus]
MKILKICSPTMKSLLHSLEDLFTHHSAAHKHPSPPPAAVVLRKPAPHHKPSPLHLNLL